MRLLAFMMCALYLAGCTSSSFTAFRENQEGTLDEIRMEIADLRHALHGTDTQVQLLEERVEAAERPPAASKSDEAAPLKKQISALEKSIDKIQGEVRSLTNYTNQIAASLSQHREQILTKLEEVSKLRSTLAGLSKEARSLPSPSTYQVKTGDSLEKIARQHHVSVDALKRENKLSSDKIIIGQELVIPSAEQ